MYYVIYTTACGSTVDSLDLRIKPAPLLKVEGKDSICLYDSTFLYTTSEPGKIVVPGQTRWFVGDKVFHTDTLRVKMDTSNLFVTVMDYGTNGCWGKDTIWIAPRPLPNIKILDNGEGITCLTNGKTQNVPLVLTATGDADTYKWIQPDGTPCSYDAEYTVNLPLPTTTTIYSVEGTDGNGCKNQGHYYYVVIPSIPPAELRDAEVCQKASYDVEVKSSLLDDLLLFYWLLPNGNTDSVPNLHLEHVTYEDTGVYKFIRFLQECFDTAQFTLTISCRSCRI